MSTGQLRYVKQPTSNPISGYTIWAVNIFNWYNDKLLEPPYETNSYLTKIARDKLKNGDTVIVEIDNKIIAKIFFMFFLNLNMYFIWDIIRLN